jgi:hypothetical protein
MTPDQRQRIGANCRLHGWQQLRPLLMQMHVPAGASPQVIVQWLEDAPAQLRSTALRLLKAMEHKAWRVEALQGPFHDPRLGFHVITGNQVWWLRFDMRPQVRVSGIESVVRTA